ncbi:hypothetical protein P9112_011546 [Eukaryota sp. TZLM1-RC]
MEDLMKLENKSPQCPVLDSSNLIINYNQILGRGGFATVYGAQWFSLNVAVKIVDIVDEGPAKLQKEIGIGTHETQFSRCFASIWHHLH